MLLAIDTATRVISMALHDGKTLLAEKTWLAGNQHGTQLAPTVATMLDQCEVAVEELTAVAASVGPGSFTGLRIGVAFAKGIAAVQGLPLVGITSLDTLAAGQPQYPSRFALIAVAEAGRGRIIVQTYRWGKNQWVSRAEARLMDWDELLTKIDGPAYITGEVSPIGQEAIAAASTQDLPVYLVPPVYRLRRAGFMAELAWAHLDEAQDVSRFDPALLIPIYLKTDSTP